MKHPNVSLTADGGAEPFRHEKKRYHYASIRFDRELIGSDDKETEFADDGSDYVILTEEEIDEILDPKPENETTNTEEIYYDDNSNFNASQKTPKQHGQPLGTKIC